MAEKCPEEFFLIFQAVHSNIDWVMMTETNDRDHIPVNILEGGI